MYPTLNAYILTVSRLPFNQVHHGLVWVRNRPEGICRLAKLVSARIPRHFPSILSPHLLSGSVLAAVVACLIARDFHFR